MKIQRSVDDAITVSDNSGTAGASVSRLAPVRAELSKLPRWARRGLLVLAGATVLLAVASVVGFSLSMHNYRVATERHTTIQALQSSVSGAEDEVDVANETISDLEAEVGTIEGREKVVNDLQTALDVRETTLTEREAAVTAREAAVDAKEQQVEASTFGDGVRVVGTTIQPGVYTTQGPDGNNPVGCYYAWKSGTGSDADIVDNNIVNGAATVTLRAGEIFESSSCQDWIKVG